MAKSKMLLIVANQPSENTRKMVEAAVRGASHPDIDEVDVTYLEPWQAGPDEVMAADALLLGTTENFGYMSGAIKDFFERIYYPCLENTEGLPYGLYIRAGSDGTGTEIAVQKIITGLKWNQVQPRLLCQGAFQPDFISQVEELAMTMAAGLAADIF